MDNNEKDEKRKKAIKGFTMIGLIVIAELILMAVFLK